MLGPEEHLRTFSRDAIVAFRERHWAGGRGGAFLVGNLEHVPENQELVESLRPLPVDPRRRRLRAGAAVRARRRWSRSATPTSRTCGSPTAPRSTPATRRERAALAVYSTLLGGSMGSRLFDEIREQRGLAYSVYSVDHAFADVPILQLRPGLESAKCVEAYARMREIVDELRADGPPRRRSSAPRAYAAGRRVLAFENTNAVARHAANQTVVYGQEIDPDAAIAALDAGHLRRTWREVARGDLRGGVGGLRRAARRRPSSPDRRSALTGQVIDPRRGGWDRRRHEAPSSTPWRALPVLLAGAVMVVLDFFIVNVALPSIATELGAGESALEWVVAGYGLDLRRVPDHRRPARRRPRPPTRLHARARAVHGESAACGLAPTPPTLILARLAPGRGRRRCSCPRCSPIIGVTYRGRDHVRALSLYGVALGLAAVGGQVLGGALVQMRPAGLGWRSCFLINVPIGLVALAPAPRLVPESRAQPSGPRLDVGRRRHARARAHRDPGAADRGPPARLAGSGRGLTRGRPADRSPPSSRGSARSAPVAPTRCSTSGCSASAASPPASPRSSASRAPRRPSSSSSRCTCSPAAASGRSRRASCSPSWRSPTSPCPRPRRP